METRSGGYGNYLLPILGCTLFALGWLLGGGLALTRGEPTRTASKAADAEIAKLKKQIVNLQGQQSRLARELDEAQTSRRKIRELEEELASVRSEVAKLKKEPRGPIGIIRDIAGAINPTPTPEPTPSPAGE